MKRAAWVGSLTLAAFRGSYKKGLRGLKAEKRRKDRRAESENGAGRNFLRHDGRCRFLLRLYSKNTRFATLPA